MDVWVERLPWVLAFLAVGAAAGWLWGRVRAQAAAAAVHALQLELATRDERLRGAESQAAGAQLQRQAAEQDSRALRDELEAALHAKARFEERALRVPRLEAELQQAQAEIARQQALLAEERARADHERTRAEEQLQLLHDARATLTEQFKNLAGEILEDKSRRFLEQNRNSLGSLLEPLRTRLAEFQGRVEQVYVDETKGRTALQEQVRQLAAMNQTLSRDAQNLASALKGSSKVQGNWGELILERVLEQSGLRRDVEFLVQPSYARADSGRAVPDVVLKLPEGRNLVIDSKVSLTAYERHASAASDEERAAALKAHLESVRSHVRNLSGKGYHGLPGVNGPDFVMAFIPIEPAFAMAIGHDGRLLDEAMAANVLLVSPSTLLAVLRTVAHLWRQEAQSRNAQDIARRGAELYDKLCGFVGDLELVGARLDSAKTAYEAAHKKLRSGKGNAIGQADKLRKLGIKPTKSLPPLLLEAAGVDEPDESPVEESCVDG